MLITATNCHKNDYFCDEDAGARATTAGTKIPGIKLRFLELKAAQPAHFLRGKGGYIGQISNCQRGLTQLELITAGFLLFSFGTLVFDSLDGESAIPAGSLGRSMIRRSVAASRKTGWRGRGCQCPGRHFSPRFVRQLRWLFSAIPVRLRLCGCQRG